MGRTMCNQWGLMVRNGLPSDLTYPSQALCSGVVVVVHHTDHVTQIQQLNANVTSYVACPSRHQNTLEVSLLTLCTYFFKAFRKCFDGLKKRTTLQNDHIQDHIELGVTIIQAIMSV